MAKETKRVTAKGYLSVEDGTITEIDRELGEVIRKISEILDRFDGEEVSLSISYDTVIDGEVQDW